MGRTISERERETKSERVGETEREGAQVQALSTQEVTISEMITPTGSEVGGTRR